MRLLACLGGHKDFVEYLVGDQNVRTNPTNGNGWTALHRATNKGHLDVVKNLAEKADMKVDAAVEITNDTALHLDILGGGHLDVVPYLVEEQNADINATISSKKHNALHVAVAEGHEDVVEYLMGERDADAEARTNKGCTALLFAITEG